MPAETPPTPATPPTPPTPREGAELLAAARAGTPFLVWRDAEGVLRLLDLHGVDAALTVGRTGDLRLDWDEKVSRVHCQLAPVGPEWTVVDDGLSRNGTYVNGERVTTRRRLRDGDALRVGATVVQFRSPEPGSGETQVDVEARRDAVGVTPAQRAVLQALCRPFDVLRGDPPATNEAIAAELVLSVDAVKAHLRQLYARFDLTGLAPHQKRDRLAREALRRGLVSST